ncbi:SDR family NAD(P)-dependent oxidoreductase [Agromyces sp. MMS24-JH15]|uniref:SDR family NAD(P)-dependent oxidoreductase n=1 Tax=Agromyces sp. MMS24-JH15 TaxID=3243765 RepID=UPI003749FC3D
MPDAPTAVPGPAASEPSVRGRTVLVAGATNASGRAVAEALVEAGATVVAVGRDRVRIDALARDLPGVVGEVADLADEDAVLELAMRVRARVGDLDGLVHLVGGWRGGGGILSQSDDDYRVLERSFTALRFESLAFFDDLARSEAGRVVIVSSTTVERPRAGSANYAAVKAASESWTRSLADGFASGSPSAAAVIVRVGSLAGSEAELGASVVALWRSDASELNGRTFRLGA